MLRLETACLTIYVIYIESTLPSADSELGAAIDIVGYYGDMLR